MQAAADTPPGLSRDELMRKWGTQPQQVLDHGEVMLASVLYFTTNT